VPVSVVAAAELILAAAASAADVAPASDERIGGGVDGNSRVKREKDQSEKYVMTRR
jgi:hypothetical protein